MDKPRDPTRLFHERLLRLPENILLDLARNYLGDIQTPFNKHDILARLETWLRTPAVHQRVRDFLSLRERRILTVLLVLDCATEDTLYGFLGADYSRLDFHLKLLNLEDRLLVFRDPDMPSPQGFRLVPHFLPTLAPLLDRKLLLPSTPAPALARPRTGVDHLVGVALACLDGMHLPVNRKGEFRKRERAELGRRLEPLAREQNLDEAGLDRLIHSLVRGLHHLGLVVVQDNHLWIHHERLASFAALTAPRRRELFCAAALYPEPEQLKRHPEDDNPEYFSLRRIHEFALRQEAFLALFNPREIYEAPALDTLAALAGCQDLPFPPRDWAEGLAGLERLSQAPSGWQLTSWPDEAVPPPATAQARVEGSFTVTILGEPDLPVLLPLVQSAELETFGPSSRWLLQKERFQRWLGHGGCLADFKDTLARLGSPELPQNVLFTLEAWAEDQGNIDFVDGVLVTVRGRRQAILEHLPGIAPWILARPAPGMLLLDRSGQESWVKALKEADFATSAWETRHRQQALMLPDFLSLEPGPRLPHPTQVWPDSLSPGETGTGSQSPALPGGPVRPQIIQDQLRLAENLDTSDEIKAELRQRIQDGLLILPEQISPQAVRVDRLEAGGLDYQAKRRIIDQVIKSGRDFLEISLLGDEDYASPRVVLPIQVKASGTEQLLLAQTVPEGRELSFIVRKILRLKRVRSGFFF